ncbi:MAG TPA: phosphatidylserine/phosphatidylglycerophosphate/cardiolipin synthase family protein [Candidatus Ozemobacteraceae bacterium]|mgnify:CR=1 FL=1|nr:phosphatidylserine/phosphatidylglycerophosphate/cardiolipin synthase family protein [Candidatus Ozemobacteraceae bacterium]
MKISASAQGRTPTRRYWLILFSLFLTAAPLFAESENLKSVHDRYLAAYTAYTQAVSAHAAPETIQRLAGEYETARQAYQQAVGTNTDSPQIATQAASSDISGESQTESLIETTTQADTTSLSDRSPVSAEEQQRFDQLMKALYAPDRGQSYEKLVGQLQDFLKTARNPKLRLDAIMEIVTLHTEAGHHDRAEKLLQTLAARTSNTEVRRQATTRLKEVQLAREVQRQRAEFTRHNVKCLSLWSQICSTSWFKPVSKVSKLVQFGWNTLGRKWEARKLESLIDEYNEQARKAFPMGSLDQLTNSRLLPGNDITLLCNGRTSFSTRYALARQARETIELQTLLYHNDETGNELADILIERAQAGVEVRVIIDDAFAQGRKDNIIRKMINGGVQVRINNPILAHPLRANFRSHQKVFIIDGTSAVVGGMNIANEYAYGESVEFGWRDTDVLVKGPVVHFIGKLFDENWEELDLERFWPTTPDRTKEVKEKVEKMPILPNRATLIPGPLPVYFAQPPRFQNVRVRFLTTFPRESDDDDILDLFGAYLKACTKEAIFETAYFIPTKPLKEAIIDACRRGVKVKILTNSAESNNHPNAGYAGRSFYRDVIEAGAEVYEWQGAQTLHSKVSLFDDFACTLGAYNVNSRSHSCDSEDVLAIEDRRMAAVFRTMLLKDLARARQVTMSDLDAWKKQIDEALKQNFWRLFTPIF